MDADTHELVKRAVAGDELALTLVLQRTRPELLACLRHRIPVRCAAQIDAEDVVQETHVRVFAHIRSFADRGPDSFMRWLRTIAIRRLRDLIKAQDAARRRGPVVAAGQPADESFVALLDLVAGSARTPSRSVARLEAIACVRDALQGLPDDYRQALWLVHIEGKPVADAARIMDRTERAIHGLTRRGLEQLRTRLGGPAKYLSRPG